MRPADLSSLDVPSSLGAMPSLRRAVAAFAFILPLAAALSLEAATFNVNTTLDLNRGACTTATGGCSLREAIRAANATQGADTINLPAGTYTLTRTGQFEDAADTGDLDITRPLTISGAGAATTIIDGNGIDRIFDILPMGATTISGVTLRNGNPGGDVGGGAIYNSATTTLSNVVIVDNAAGISGGGILNDGTLTLVDVTVHENMANRGGAIDNVGTLTVRRSTLSGNSALTGGAISNDGTVTLENTTMSGNTGTGGGGALRNNATATLRHVTIANNSAGGASGGGISNNSDLDVRYTIVANSPSGGTCANTGDVTSGGRNVDSGNTCGFTGTADQVNQDPLLTPLQANGGPTLTHGLFLGSPAVDVGGADCPGTITTDQRGTGFPRALDGDGNGTVLCDSGAYELNRLSPPTTTTLVSTTTTTTSTTTTLPGLCGDVNGDGIVDIGDALVVAQYDVGLRSCGLPPFGHPERCDANGDGFCDIGDALRMAQCDVGLISCVFTCGPFACP